MSATAFPLQWPAGAARTKKPARSAFGEVTILRATLVLIGEIERMRGRLPVISTNLELRGDGRPYSKQRPIHDNGVAVYFTWRDRQLVFACDRWDRIEHNMRAIAKTIDALRGIERWGSTDLMERAFTGFEALPAPEQWFHVLGVSDGAGRDEISRAYREAAQKAHPDKGGSEAAMMRLNAARSHALAAIAEKEDGR